MEPTSVAAPVRLPAVYATDADELFDGLATLAAALQGAGEVAPFILVGIGYERSNHAELLRLRDFLTPAIRTHLRPLIERAAFESGAPPGGLQEISETTGAAEFLQFIREELIPHIEGHHPAKASARGYFGYSAGATFGLYTLFKAPDTFEKYLLGSPSTSYGGHHYGIDLGNSWTEQQTSDALIYLSVGELEEEGTERAPFELVTGFHKLVQFLNGAARPPFRVQAEVFPKETHATAWALAFARGLRATLPTRRSS